MVEHEDHEVKPNSRQINLNLNGSTSNKCAGQDEEKILNVAKDT